jgi:hypothetical protein
MNQLSLTQWRQMSPGDREAVSRKLAASLP